MKINLETEDFATADTGLESVLERRMDIIGQNGNEGLHYVSDGHSHKEVISGTEQAYYWDNTRTQKDVREIDVKDAEEIDYKVLKAHKRKGQPVTLGVLAYFPDAIKYVAQVSKAGNDQHHPEKELHWDRAKSTDELDALARHLIDHTVDPVDDDGMYHLGKVAWRALAALQKYLENTKS